MEVVNYIGNNMAMFSFIALALIGTAFTTVYVRIATKRIWALMTQNPLRKLFKHRQEVGK